MKKWERSLRIAEYKNKMLLGPLRQRDMMRMLYLQYGENERAVVNAYTAAERAGKVRRKRNRNGVRPGDYAQGVFRTGLREGWIYPEE